MLARVPGADFDIGTRVCISLIDALVPLHIGNRDGISLIDALVPISDRCCLGLRVWGLAGWHAPSDRCCLAGICLLGQSRGQNDLLHASQPE